MTPSLFFMNEAQQVDSHLNSDSDKGGKSPAAPEGQNEQWSEMRTRLEEII